MPSNSVVELQQKLFKRMGLEAPGLPLEARSRRKPGLAKTSSRKDRRKAERAHRKTQRYSQQPHPPQPPARPSDASNLADGELVPGIYAQIVESGEEDLDSSPHEQSPTSSNEGETGRGLSKSMRERLAQDDAEIEALEKKLGIKQRRKTVPKAFRDDGLDDLLGDTLDDVSGGDEGPSKRRREFDEWLSSKRRKTASKDGDGFRKDHNESSIDSDEGAARSDAGYGSGLDGGDSDDGSFQGFEPDVEAVAAATPRPRENPYVAPTTDVAVAKYIPPSRRPAASSGNETRDRLRKQIRGQINRLTDDNILSIVQSIDDIYQRNARGDVTELLTDTVMAQLCRPESLPDQFFVLTGGFSAAVYKITGSSFGSHLVHRVVKEFGNAYEKANLETDDQGFHRKETSNLIAFLTQLYVFGVVGCRMLFDYMERLLQEISEINVELLVRICRMAGRLLRRDDPQALKHVSTTLSQAVSKVGFANVTARTKFMVDLISDIKNSKPRAKGLDSVVVSEHVLRMRKRLGELKTQSRRLDGLAAMGMRLDDIEGADTHGKWWLVGASVPAYREMPDRRRESAERRARSGSDDATDDEDMDFVLPNFPNKARAQGLGTSAQVAIFTAIMSANSYEQGYQQYTRLKLKKDEQLEIARVLVQCVGSEEQYNEYYGLVASLACASGRVRFALQDRLWKLFRALGESLFGEATDEEETADSERMRDERRASHVARFYAYLVGNGDLSIGILKPLELPEMNQRSAAFVECFMVSLLNECRGKKAVEEASVEKIFGPARELPSLAAGIQWFLGTKIRKSRLVEAKKLGRVIQKVRAAVQVVQAGDGT